MHFCLRVLGFFSALAGLARERSAAARVDEILQQPQMRYGTRTLPPGPGRIEMRGQELGYGSVSRTLLIIIIPMPMGISGENSIPETTWVIGHGGGGPTFAIARGLSSLRLPVSGTPKFFATGRCSIFERQEAQHPKTEMTLGRPDLEHATRA